MILFVSALDCEAKPLICHFDLKRDKNNKHVDTFENENQGIRLVVSGVGILKSAISTAVSLSKIEHLKQVQIINLGICGSPSQQYDLGSPVLMNQIINSETKKCYYPDRIQDFGLPEGTITSFSTPVFDRESLPSPTTFVDMEAAGFMEAAMMFLQPHQVHCVKIISDYLDIRHLTPSLVSHLIGKNLEIIHHMVHQLKTFSHLQKPATLTDRDLDLLSSLSDTLNLTETMQHQLKNAFVYYKLKGNHPFELLHDYLAIEIRSKVERKRIFDEICRRLNS